MPISLSDKGMLTKPNLTKHIDLKLFKSYYWLKTELVEFCRKNGLISFGSKTEISNRIEAFIKTGTKIKPTPKKKTGVKDSKTFITMTTPVIHYKNDVATREFFVQQIGPHFRFNAYLREFRTKKLKKVITYGDLVKGWLEAEKLKKNSSQKKIGKQFEYNQFIRDFFKNEKDKMLKEAIQAWKIVRALQGPSTYSYYKKISSC